MKARFIAGLCLALAVFAFVLPAQAAEEIRSFSTNIVLRADRSVDVTETIEVRSEGDRIRRGIYRDIPTTLLNADGSLVRSNLDVVSVTRDGRPEPHVIEGLGNNHRRIRIGDAEVLLTDGIHRYAIRYTMTRMSRSFPDHDELYFNSTGHFWEFPIRSSVATITLPDGAVIENLVGYTGPPGSTEQAVTITRQGDNRAVFRTTRALAPGEGVTVAASFQKGILEAPEGLTAALNWLSDHRDVILPLIAVALLLLYFYFAWDSVGRDPKKGTIIPLFHPPKNLSPALAHYVHEMGFQQDGWKAFTASIFNLGVKGLVTIENVGKSLTFAVTGKEPEKPLPPGENVIFDHVRADGRIRIDKNSGPALHRKRGEFVFSLEAENRQLYFKNNRGYAVLGAALALLCLGSLVWLEVLGALWLILSIVGGAAVGLFTSAFSSIWKGNGFSRFAIAVWIVIAGSNLLGGFGSLFTNVHVNTGAWAAASITVVTLVFFTLLRAPTVQGRRLMDQIEGFLMYLDTAEKQRLNLVGEPPMTVERFETILPYAIALGVEKPWSQHFEAELARNAVADATNASYSPRWYSGKDFSPGRISNTVSSAAAGMSAAMIAAQPASSSSSGFSSGGGGGSSGGGGGGGGGGGW